MNLLRLSPLALAFAFSIISCNKPDGDCTTTQPAASPGIAAGGCVVVDPCAQPCGPDVVCTMDFRSVTVSATDASHNPLALDSFVVTDVAGVPLAPVNGERIYGLSEPGRVNIVSDLWVNGHQGMQMDVRAKGFKNGALVFDQSYTIGADCCHVYKAAGPDVIAKP